MQKYSSYMSILKIKELQTIKFGNEIQGFRNISYKNLFFRLLDTMNFDDKTKLKEVISAIKLTYKKLESNNQPFDLSNFETFYFYLCRSLIEQIDENNKYEDEYLLSMKTYINSISKILKNYRKENYEEEKRNIKNF